MLEGFFGFIFGWAVDEGPLFGIIVVSFILTLLTTLAYKLFTDQNVMKALKEEMKHLQTEMKKFKDQPDKMMSIQKELMDKNMKMFKNNLKPMLKPCSNFLNFWLVKE
jgi:uncharacterized membrane protein (DUF106 family)